MLNISNKQQKRYRFIVGLIGLVDLGLKFLTINSENAVINQQISGGVGEFYWWMGAILLWVGWKYQKHKSIGWWMILVGGISNLLSRWLWGGVVDYWSLLGILQNNLADYLIVVGGFLLILSS